MSENLDRTPKRMCVKIRRDIGRDVKPAAEALDGRQFVFVAAWKMGETDPYPGELAMMPHDDSYPRDAPLWIASGDLEEV